MMISSIASYNYTPARAQNFEGKLTDNIHNSDPLKKISADKFQKTDTSHVLTKTFNKDTLKTLEKNFSKTDTDRDIIWTLDHLDSLQEKIDKLQKQVKKEKMLYGSANTDTVTELNRYVYILKQVQTNGIFTETPTTFRRGI